jgi:hypothetical protein
MILVMLFLRMIALSFNIIYLFPFIKCALVYKWISVDG